MLRRLFGADSQKTREQREEKEESKRLELLRDLSALRKTCKDNVESAYGKCVEGSHHPLMSRMAVHNATLLKSNEGLLQKCDKALLNLQSGTLRRKSASLDRLNDMEFNASYRRDKRLASKSNVSRLRKRAMKMEGYRTMRNGHRDLINDALRDNLSDLFDEDDDDDNDFDAAVEFVNSIKENQVIDSILAAPNPIPTSVDDVRRNDDMESELRDDNV